MRHNNRWNIQYKSRYLSNTLWKHKQFTKEFFFPLWLINNVRVQCIDIQLVQTALGHATPVSHAGKNTATRVFFFHSSPRCGRSAWEGRGEVDHGLGWVRGARHAWSGGYNEGWGRRMNVILCFYVRFLFMDMLYIQRTNNNKYEGQEY